MFGTDPIVFPPILMLVNPQVESVNMKSFLYQTVKECLKIGMASPT